VGVVLCGGWTGGGSEIMGEREPRHQKQPLKTHNTHKLTTTNTHHKQYSFFLSNIVSYLYDPDPHVVRTKAYFWAGMFPILACVVAAATFTQLLAFTVMGERLTTRLRDLAFRNIVRQVRCVGGGWV
jgi:hypothetical protein